MIVFDNSFVWNHILVVRSVILGSIFMQIMFRAELAMRRVGKFLDGLVSNSWQNALIKNVIWT